MTDTRTKDQVQAEYKEFSAKLSVLATKGASCTPVELTEFNDVVKPKLSELKAELDRFDTVDAIKAAAGDNAAYLKLGTSIEHSLEMPVAAGNPRVVKMDFAGNTIVNDARVIVGESGHRYNDAQVKAFRNPEYKSAIDTYIRRAGIKDYLSSGEFKTLQEGLDTEGGYLLPEDFLAKLIEKKPTPTRVADYTTQMTTSVDRKIIPKVIYTADNLYTTGMRVTWTGENPGSATAARVTDPVFGTVNIPVYTALMSLPITRDLLEDAAFDLQGWITDKFRETIDLLRDNMVLNGTGNNMPTGILQNVGGVPPAPIGPAYVATGNATSLTGDGFVNLSFSLPEQYDENARYIMNKTNTGKATATLKDGTGRYLWGMGLQDSGLAPGGLGSGQRQLNGYPVTWSGFMPNVAANAYPALFGDLRGYFLVNRIGLTVQVLNELYAEQNFIVLLGRIRFGGQLAEEYKMYALKVAVS